MLQELLDKIAVVAATLFALELVQQFVQHRPRDNIPSISDRGGEDLCKTGHDSASGLAEDRESTSIHKPAIEIKKTTPEKEPDCASGSAENDHASSHKPTIEIKTTTPETESDCASGLAEDNDYASSHKPAVEIKTTTLQKQSECGRGLPARNECASSYKSATEIKTTTQQNESEKTFKTINEAMRVNGRRSASGSTTAFEESTPRHSTDSEESTLLRQSENTDQENTRTLYGTISIIAPQEGHQAFFRSCNESLYISCTITLAVIPVSLVMIAVLYFDVNTSNICSHQMLINNSLPQDVMKYVIIGHDIEAIALNFWFQLMLVLLFGWAKFKQNYACTLLLGFLLGLTVVIFKTTLFFMDVEFTQTKYRYPGNFVFLFGVVYSSYLVAKRVYRTYSSDILRLTKLHVCAIVSTQFFLGFLIAMAYRYVFMPLFRETKDEIGRLIVALITPTLILVPMVIAENLALKSLQFTDAGHIFVLVYFVNGVSIFLYCIMQAGVKSTNIFIALSVFRGILQILLTATVKMREKVVTGIWNCLERKCHCRTPHRGCDQSRYLRRLRVDKEIQIMLYQSTAIILSQAYLVLYLVSNYHVETRKILQEFIIKRALIGIGTSVVANYVSIFLHIHWHKTQLAKVWYDNWKLHFLAITLGGVMSICYFTAVLLSAFETFANSLSYNVKNCTAPFQ